jgi:CTP synthase
VPLMLQREKLDDLVAKHLKLELPPADMTAWRTFVDRIINPKHHIRVGVVGKYMENRDAYKSIYEALTHAGAAADSGVEVVPVDAEDIEELGAGKFLTGLDGILVPGGFGVRGVEGKILAARFARTQKKPYLGLCLGLQIAAVDFARDVLGLTQAHSTEFDSETPEPIISMLDDQKQVVKKGGTMRLGAQVCHLVAGTKTHEAYGRAWPRRRWHDRRPEADRGDRARGPSLVRRLPVPSRVPVQAEPAASALQRLRQGRARGPREMSRRWANVRALSGRTRLDRRGGETVVSLFPLA